MSHKTLTVRFRGRGPQNAWLTRLQTFCRNLVDNGTVKEAKVTVVFPDHQEPRMAGMFMVDLEDAPDDVAGLFERISDVQYATPPASRQ